MFDWDDKKSDRNYTERGFDFEYASLVFECVTVERVDGRKDYGEQRIVALGLIDNFIYCVVYTWRIETRRLISARVASPKERNVYHRALSPGDQGTEGAG